MITRLNTRAFNAGWSYVAAIVSLFACFFIIMDGPFPNYHKMGDFLLFFLWPACGVLGVAGCFLNEIYPKKIKTVVALAMVGLLAAIPFLILCAFFVFSLLASLLVSFGDGFSWKDFRGYGIILIVALSVLTITKNAIKHFIDLLDD